MENSELIDFLEKTNSILQEDKKDSTDFDELLNANLGQSVVPVENIGADKVADSSTVGRWNDDEQAAFLRGLEKFGKDWKKLSEMIPTRTLMQIRTHAQKYFKKIKKENDKVVIEKEDVQLEESRWSLESNDTNIFRDLGLLSPTSEKRKCQRRSRTTSIPEPCPSGHRDSFPHFGSLHKKTNASCSSLRSGRWTREEEEYANLLISEFAKGLLPLPDGVMLRYFLAKALNCDPMRISKKFAGGLAIGKNTYRRNQDRIDALTTDELLSTRQKLALLEKRFLVASNQIAVEQKKSTKESNFIEVNITKLKPSIETLNHRSSPQILFGSESSFQIDTYLPETAAVSPELLLDQKSTAKIFQRRDTESERPLALSEKNPSDLSTDNIQISTETGDKISSASDNVEWFKNVQNSNMKSDDPLVKSEESSSYGEVFRPVLTTNRRFSQEAKDRQEKIDIEDIGKIMFKNEETTDSLFILNEIEDNAVEIDKIIQSVQEITPRNLTTQSEPFPLLPPNLPSKEYLILPTPVSSNIITQTTNFGDDDDDEMWQLLTTA